jgi:predicted ATPase
MLRELYVDNFKTWLNAVYRPGPVNLLVGKNNAGKSNLLQAMRFLAVSTYMPLLDAAKTATGEPMLVPNVLHEQEAVSLRCVCDVTFEQEALAFEYELVLNTHTVGYAQSYQREFRVATERLRAFSGGFETQALIHRDGENVRLLNERDFLAEGRDYILETTVPPTQTMLYSLYESEIHARANCFKRYLGSWLYYDLDGFGLRSIEARPLDWVLRPDGSNLASVLLNLKNTDERRYRELLDVFRLVEPELDVLNFVALPGFAAMFVADKAGHYFHIGTLSPGTLRFFALAYILMANRQPLTGALGAPPVVMVEEPENGIYVGHLKTLFKELDWSGGTGQLVFASHNPYFIDLFEKVPESVITVRKSETRSELQSPDADRMSRILREMSLGEAHFRELLI